MGRFHYPNFDHRLTERMVDGYCEMVQERIDEGYEPYLLTIMFREIRGPRHGVFSRMWESTDEAYRRCLKRIVRNPRAPKELYIGYGSQIRRISAEPIIETPEKATNYVFKALKRGRVTMDDIWIFPRSRSELSSRAA